VQHTSITRWLRNGDLCSLNWQHEQGSNGTQRGIDLHAEENPFEQWLAKIDSKMRLRSACNGSRAAHGMAAIHQVGTKGFKEIIGCADN